MLDLLGASLASSLVGLAVNGCLTSYLWMNKHPRTQSPNLPNLTVVKTLSRMQTLMTLAVPLSHYAITIVHNHQTY